MIHYSPLRYPGGKAFLASELERILMTIGLRESTYVEPYAGGAGAALALLFSEKVGRVVINDLDPAIYAFWKAVTMQAERFAKKILAVPLTVAQWKKQKRIYRDATADAFDRGFAAFFLNRTNRSGVMNAGPIGGIEQGGKYKINVRFNRRNLAERVRKIGRYADRIDVLNEDGVQLTKRHLKKKNTFIYLDPPYFKKGAMLYLNHYDEENHKELANLLNLNIDKHWVLTYDEVSEIRKLYPARRRRLSLKYRVRGSRKARELMISSAPAFI